MLARLLSCLQVLLAASVSSAAYNYTGARVIRADTRSLPKSILDHFNVDVWAENSNFTDMMVMPRQFDSLMKILKKRKVPYQVMIGDVQSMIEEQDEPSYHHDFEDDFRGRGGIKLDQYNKLNTIHKYLDYLEEKYPDLVTVGVMGSSHQGRPLKYIFISSGKEDAKAVFIDGGIHAREWISPATVVYMIHELVENRSHLPKHLRETDFYILPVANPDGYHFSFTTNRLWRKNRSKKEKGCRGVDLNRNFGYKWGGRGTSGHSCSQVYRGTAPFSEPESRAMGAFLADFASHIQAYVSLHSYSQLILLPYGYEGVLPEDFDHLLEVGQAAAEAIHKSDGRIYEVGNSVHILYAAAGGSFDWAKAEAGIKYSYTFELRDTGRFGFLLPASQILSTAKEMFEAIGVIAKAL